MTLGHYDHLSKGGAGMRSARVYFRDPDDPNKKRRAKYTATRARAMAACIRRDPLKPMPRRVKGAFFRGGRFVGKCAGRREQPTQQLVLNAAKLGAFAKLGLGPTNLASIVSPAGSKRVATAAGPRRVTRQATKKQAKKNAARAAFERPPAQGTRAQVAKVTNTANSVDLSL